MARRKNKGNIPTFFSLPQSSKVSFKVKKTTSNNQPANSQYPDDSIKPRGDYEDTFLLDESIEGRPRIFSPEQTYNYKSAWKRYQKGMELVQREQVLEDPGDSDKYKCVSPKAPKGYWEITKKNTDPPDPPDCIPINLEWTTISIGNVNPTLTPTVFYSANSKVGVLTQNFVDLFFPDQADDDLTESFTFAQRSEWFRYIEGSEITASVSGLINIEWGVNTPQNSSDNIFFVAYLKFFTTQGYEEILEVNSFLFDTNPQQPENGSVQVIYDLPRSISFEIEMQAIPEIYPGEYLYIEIGVTTNVNIPPESIEQTYQARASTKIENNYCSVDDGDDDGDGDEEDNNNEWECNCPDSSKKKDPNPRSTNSNNETPEGWTDSDAGAQNGECKHIWAVRILREEVSLSEIPKDMPISEIFPDSSNDGKNGASGQPRVIGGQGGIGFDNWNHNQRRKADA